jgi:NAD(P)H-flavin reductase
MQAGQQLYLPEPAKIKAAKQFTELERWFEIELPEGRDLMHKPMQFAEFSVFGIGEAPFSISSSPTRKGSFEICVRNVGSLSRHMMNMDAGDAIGVRGPMGNGVEVDELVGKDVVIIAGGIGLVPVRSLINYIFDNRGDFGKFTILYGCKSPKERLYTDELAAWEADPNVDYRDTVDRGDDTWSGRTGVITTLIPDLAMDASRTKVVIVGPPVMFKFVLLALRPKGLSDDDIIMSLERRMKCGVGKCGHCQINNVYVCRKGPVFTYGQVKHLEEAL